MLIRSSNTKKSIPEYMNFSFTAKNKSLFITNQAFNDDSFKLKCPKVVSLDKVA